MYKKTKISRAQCFVREEMVNGTSIGAIACSRPKFLKKFRSRARERTASVRKCSWVWSGWISIGSELSSLNLHTLVRAKQLFAIHNSKVVIKPLCGNLDICLNYYANAYFRSQKFVRVQTATEMKRFFKSCFSVALLNSTLDLTTYIHFSRKKTEHANAPIVWYLVYAHPNLVACEHWNTDIRNSGDLRMEALWLSYYNAYHWHCGTSLQLHNYRSMVTAICYGLLTLPSHYWWGISWLRGYYSSLGSILMLLQPLQSRFSSFLTNETNHYFSGDL